MWNARVLTLSAALLLAACGSSGGGTPPTVSAVFSADAANSGYVVDGTSTFSGALIAAGDAVAESVARGFYRFDISGFPAGGVVVAATLRTGHETFVGAPYAEFGNLVVDHVTLGAGLDDADFAAAALTVAIGILSTNNTQEAKTMNATAAIQADVAASRTTSDYRIYFVGAPDGEADNDWVNLTNTGSPGVVGVEPVLIVDYYVP